MPKPRVLVTGGTGFLGKRVVPLLREHFDVDVFSRSADAEVRGDLTKWNGGVDDVSALRSRDYAAMVHLAALYDLGAGREECFLHNVVGTSHALRLCHLAGIGVFVNASSVAAAINSKQHVVKPNDLSFDLAFPDPYSESKALAEQMIHNWEGSPGLRVNLRLGVLVGDTAEGRIERVDGPYRGPAVFDGIRGLIESIPGPLPLPGSEHRALPLVPVDVCASAVTRFTSWALSGGETGYKSFHVVPERGLSILDFYKRVLEHIGLGGRKVLLLDHLPSTLVRKASKWIMKFPEEELTYLLSFPRFDAGATARVLGEGWCPEFENYENAFWSGYEQFVSNR